MAKVILIALLSPLAVLATESVTTEFGRALCPALAQGFNSAVGWTSPLEGRSAPHFESPATALPRPSSFEGLNPVNRLDAVESPVRPSNAEADRIVGLSKAKLRAATPGPAAPDHWPWYSMAALSSAPNELTAPQRPQARIGRERKLLPHRRQLQRSQVGLARKQP